MNKYSEKYAKIKNQLVRKSFPELKSKKIFIGEIWMRKHWSGWACYIPPFRFIGLSKNLRKDSDKIARGIIAHELCHFSLISKRSLFGNILVGLSYWFFSAPRKKEEYDVDKLLIGKGYARESYLATKAKEKQKSKAKVQKYYMSSQEIKNYAKKIRKW